MLGPKDRASSFFILIVLYNSILKIRGVLVNKVYRSIIFVICMFIMSDPVFGIKRPVLMFKTQSEVNHSKWKENYGLDISAIIKSKANSDYEFVQVYLDCTNKKEYSESCDLKITLKEVNKDENAELRFKSFGIIYVHNNIWDFSVDEVSDYYVGNLQIQIDVKDAVVSIENLRRYDSDNFFLKNTKMAPF
jgi:hypothetical protein